MQQPSEEPAPITMWEAVHGIRVRGPLTEAILKAECYRAGHPEAFVLYSFDDDAVEPHLGPKTYEPYGRSVLVASGVPGQEVPGLDTTEFEHAAFTGMHSSEDVFEARLMRAAQGCAVQSKRALLVDLDSGAAKRLPEGEPESLVAG